MSEPSRPTPWKRLQFFLFSCVLTFAACIGIDRVIGLALPIHQGLIFTPRSSAHYHTPEYDFTGTANGLGFRDRDVDIKKTTPLRIAALGDSFCYGWGVEAEQSWPKQLESDLKKDGLPVEVDNLGEPGPGPSDYADIAEKAIPLLRPDLVVVGVLQGDDLGQCEPPSPSSATDPIASSHPLRDLFPNATFLLDIRKAKAAGAIDIKSEWMKQIDDGLGHLSPKEQEHLKNLPPDLHAMLSSGAISPSVIFRAVNQPDVFSQSFDAKSARTQVLVAEMARQFHRLKDVADRYGVRVVIVSTPYPLYVSRQSWNNFRRYGFDVLPGMLTSDSPDVSIQQACRMAGLPFSTVLSQFRSDPDRDGLYYPLDTHFNAQGYARYAERITPIVEAAVKAKNGVAP